MGGGGRGGGRQLCCDLGLQAQGGAWGAQHAAVAEGREGVEGGLGAAAFTGEGHHDEGTRMRKAAARIASVAGGHAYIASWIAWKRMDQANRDVGQSRRMYCLAAAQGLYCIDSPRPILRARDVISSTLCDSFISYYI